ncbi:MAG: YjhX family toxin [Pseudomonadota bacterium]
MDISRAEQRVLHTLAKGGWIDLERDDDRNVIARHLRTREGWGAPGLTDRVFRKLKRLRAIRSRNGGPYRVTRAGLMLVRAEFDNR